MAPFMLSFQKGRQTIQVQNATSARDYSSNAPEQLEPLLKIKKKSHYPFRRQRWKQGDQIQLNQVNVTSSSTSFQKKKSSSANQWISTRLLTINTWLHSEIGRPHGDVHGDVRSPRPGHTHSSGFRRTASVSASRDPLAGSCMYSHLRKAAPELPGQRKTARYRGAEAAAGALCCVYLAVRGRDIRMLSILEPGVARPNFTPRSYTRLNSTYLRHRHTHSRIPFHQGSKVKRDVGADAHLPRRTCCQSFSSGVKGSWRCL